MKIVVSEDNLIKIISGLKRQIETKLEENNISLYEKQINDYLSIITDGDGNNFLNNKGEYSNIDINQLNSSIEEYKDIDTIFKIVKENDIYNIYLPDYDIITSLFFDGNGDKVLNDNLNYIDIISLDELSEDDINNIINKIGGIN